MLGEIHEQRGGSWCGRAVQGKKNHAFGVGVGVGGEYLRNGGGEGGYHDHGWGREGSVGGSNNTVVFGERKYDADVRLIENISGRNTLLRAFEPHRVGAWHAPLASIVRTAPAVFLRGTLVGTADRVSPKPSPRACRRPRRVTRIKTRFRDARYAAEKDHTSCRPKPWLALPRTPVPSACCPATPPWIPPPRDRA